jgi:hypothetical protein
MLSGPALIKPNCLNLYLFLWCINMFKKIFHSRFYASALALAISGNVWALTPADGIPDLSLYIPGSQANDPAFGFLVNNATVANAVCLDNALPAGGTGTTTHIYFHTLGGTPAAATVNDNYSGIYCYTDNTKIPGLTGGVGAMHKSKLWISRRRLGASFVGLDAVAHGTALTYLQDPAAAGCTAVNGSYSSGGATYQYNYSCTTVASGPASAATSDVTPDVFIGDNVTPGSTPINSAAINNVHAIGGHIIGIPVTLALRNALQYAESQTASGLVPSTCKVGDETAACVPSLTKEQLVSLFTGAITDWTQMVVVPAIPPAAAQTLADVVAAGVANGFTASPTAATYLVGGLAKILTNPLDTTVHICRRENGAGQQVAVLANILQYPCLGGSAPLLADSTALSDVQYATSLGAVDKCLADYNDGTNGWFGTTNPSPYPAPPITTTSHGNQWALSIQSTERNATNAAHYRFIKINGAAATGEQVYLGHYPLVGNYALSWITGSNNANQNAALNAITAYSKLPATIASRNSTLSNQSFGQAGYIALSDNNFAPPLTWDPTNPVTPYSKLNAKKTLPNACAIPTVNLNYGNVQLK